MPSARRAELRPKAVTNEGSRRGRRRRRSSEKPSGSEPTPGAGEAPQADPDRGRDPTHPHATRSVSTAEGVYRRLRLLVTAPTTAFGDIRAEPGVRAGVSTLAVVGLVVGAMMAVWGTSPGLTLGAQQDSEYWMARVYGLSHEDATERAGQVEAPSPEAPIRSDGLGERLALIAVFALSSAAMTPLLLAIAGAVASIAWRVIGASMATRAGVAVMVWPAIVVLPVSMALGVVAGMLGVSHYLTLAGPLPLETHPLLYLFASDLGLTDLWYVVLIAIGFSTVADGLSRRTAAVVTTMVWLVLSVPFQASMMWLYRSTGSG